MSLPTWEEFNLPVLEALSDGAVVPLRILRQTVADIVHLSDAERAVTVPSGQFTYEVRISWAASYLTRVGALERPRRGYYRITDKGKQLLRDNPRGITEATLREVANPDDQWWIKKERVSGADKSLDSVEVARNVLDPTEQVEEGIERIHEDVAYQLLSRLQEREPEFFERAVVDLLLEMGYGGAHGRGSVTPFTHDGGIDGVIDQDALGLNKVYVQAKRYASGTPVHRPEVQGFVGALSGKADGGLMITTSTFSQGALKYAEEVPARIILVDGHQLTRLMIRYGVGVEIEQTYSIVRIDEDFFT